MGMRIVVGGVGTFYPRRMCIWVGCQPEMTDRLSILRAIPHCARS